MTVPAPRAATPRAELRRDLGAGLQAYAHWLRNPVSPEGVTWGHRARFATTGPDIARQLDRMQRDPVGRRVLAERPDLGVALSDMEALAKMPEGSMGRTYHAFMDRPEVVPSALLASLLHADGHFERLPWDDEMKYFVERRTYTHDLTHVISGYGTSFPAEAINIGFIYGIEGMSGGRAFTEALAALSYAVMLPSVGPRRWHGLVTEAYRRGAAAARRRPLVVNHIEELLPLPLAEARRQMGIPPLAAPVDAPEGWIRNPIGKKMAHGYGTAGAGDRSVDVAVDLLRAGARTPDLGRADLALRNELTRRLDAGESPVDVVPVLAQGAEALRLLDRLAAK